MKYKAVIETADYEDPEFFGDGNATASDGWIPLDAGYDTDSENVKKQALLNLMKDMPLQTLQIAYVYAENYVEYGEDVTKTWNTATEQLSILQKAYRKGYYDALQRQSESEESE